MRNLRQDIERAYWQRNQLHSLLIELTARCCCRCRHCYIVPEPPPGDELSLAEVGDLLDQAVREGVMQLMLSGGEVLLRQDLPEILAHARRHRFFTTVLTSGLPLDDAAADLLAANRVEGVELSLLGATAAVNDDLMQTPGALARIEQAARRLRRRNIGVVLKATVMRPNQDELVAMAELARTLDCGFVATPSVAPRRGGGTEPLQLALDEDELAAIDPRLMTGGLIPGEDTSGGAILSCKAGRVVAGISSCGDVYPCIMWPRPVGNLRERSLQDIWHDNPDPYLQHLRQSTAADAAACAACDLRGYCRRCPGIAWQESGTATGLAPSMCAAARGTRRAVRRT
jgi:radical SAM protein with 4Fe4S-binding SPASM domain